MAAAAAATATVTDPTPHLYVYIAHSDPTRAVILRRGGEKKHKKTQWEMIAWSLDTDTFTRGQWLMGKCVAPELCSISPDGKLFYYHYDIYNSHHKRIGEIETGRPSVDAVSAVPNFSALLYTERGCGKWQGMHFCKATGLPIWDHSDAETQGDAPFVRREGADPLPCGPSVLPAGITVDGYKLLRDGVVLLDTTADVFAPREPIL